MLYALSLGAAFAAALCVGTAAVLQKIGADEEKKVRSLDVRLLWELAGDLPYIIGVCLDGASWVLTLFAVHYLPLFLVQTIIAMNIAITAILEAIFFRRQLGRLRYGAITLIVLGLILLAITAAPGKIGVITPSIKWAMLLGVIPIAAAGAVLARHRSYLATIGIAGLSGIAFGQTAVIGRIFQLYSPLWHNIYSLYVWSSLANGVLGILLLSIALQRTYATTTSATATAAQTLIPTVIGIALLGDGTRPGLWYIAILGAAFALTGTLVMASKHEHPRRHLAKAR